MPIVQITKNKKHYIMKTLKNYLLLFAFFITAGGTQLFAQDLINREVGIRLSSFNDFDFIYKKETATNKFTRYRFAFTNLNFDNGILQDNFNIGIGAAIGIEKRKPITDKFTFFHGFEPSLSLSYGRVSGTDPFDDRSLLRINPSIGYVLGVQVQLSKAFSVNVETIPSVSSSLQFQDGDFDKNYQINAGFNSNAVAVTAVYAFQSKKKIKK